MENPRWSYSMEELPDGRKGRYGMASGKLTKREEDRLLHERETLIHYWASDNIHSMMWASVFMLANSILLGGVLASNPNESILSNWVIRFLVPAAGIAMNVLWLLGISRLNVHIRYHEESEADIRKRYFPEFRFRDSEVLRPKFRGFAKISTKPVFESLPAVFFFTWVFILVDLASKCPS